MEVGETMSVAGSGSWWMNEEDFGGKGIEGLRGTLQDAVMKR